jgi:hypothetical protein
MLICMDQDKGLEQKVMSSSLLTKDLREEAVWNLFRDIGRKEFFISENKLIGCDINDFQP